MNFSNGYSRSPQHYQPCQNDRRSLPNAIGKKHALKKYDKFALHTSCFWVGCYMIGYGKEKNNFEIAAFLTFEQGKSRAGKFK